MGSADLPTLVLIGRVLWIVIKAGIAIAGLLS